MQPPATAQPTLWRTCRVIANRTRLEAFAFLLRQPEQTVSAVAGHLDLPLSMASESLRLLESRGLLAARRVGRWVKYRISPAKSAHFHSGLLTALRTTFQRNPVPTRTVFKLATAFTHPRRIELFRFLQTGPRTWEQLQATTGVSDRALARHLRKLEDRGFVRRREDIYFVADFSDGLRRELSLLATV